MFGSLIIVKRNSLVFQIKSDKASTFKASLWTLVTCDIILLLFITFYRLNEELINQNNNH